MDDLLLAVRVIVSLGVVLGVLLVVRRRLVGPGGGARPAKPMTVVARQGLGGKASIAMVEVDGARLLLGVTEHGITVLHEGEAPAAAVAAEPFDAHLDLARRDPAIRAAVPNVPNAVGGSLLDPATWRRFIATLRGGR